MGLFRLSNDSKSSRTNSYSISAFLKLEDLFMNKVSSSHLKIQFLLIASTWFNFSEK